MELSEAIRLGATLVNGQCRGTLYEYGAGGNLYACALGAARLAMGRRLGNILMLGLPIPVSEFIRVGLRPNGSVMGYRQSVTHLELRHLVSGLNDNKYYSFSEIADIVEQIEKRYPVLGPEAKPEAPEPELEPELEPEEERELVYA